METLAIKRNNIAEGIGCAFVGSIFCFFIGIFFWPVLLGIPILIIMIPFMGIGYYGNCPNCGYEVCMNKDIPVRNCPTCKSRIILENGKIKLIKKSI